MQTQLSMLQEQFSIAGELTFRDVGDGFIIVDINNEICSASIALQGAHLMTWQPKDEAPVIWLSSAAKLGLGQSIRGGVPICWPWFGAHASEASFPAHGFARTSLWDILSVSKLTSGEISICFRVQNKQQKLWASQTFADIEMVIGSTLEMTLTTENHSDETITIGEALHTYFCVGDVSKVSIRGLDSCVYIDKVDEGVRKKQEGELKLTQEVDRIYLDQGQDIVIEDPVLQRRICIEKENSHSTIVWNPWIEKSHKMGDFGSDDAYLGMLCVESANADEDVVQLLPQATHQLRVRYSVEGCL